MPRYFFHVRGEDGLKRDGEGAELADLHAAYAEGMASAKELVASSLMGGMRLELALDRAFEVEDEAGTLVLRIPFAEAAQADDHRPSLRSRPPP